MALIGDSIKLKCEFIKFDGTYADPTSITLRIYDDHLNQIGTTINITVANKVSLGIYEYIYTIPSNVKGFIYFEYSATLDGYPTVKRGKVPVSWI